MPNRLILYDITILVVDYDKYSAIFDDAEERIELERIFSNDKYGIRLIDHPGGEYTLLYRSKCFLEIDHHKFTTDLINLLKGNRSNPFIMILELRAYSNEKQKVLEKYNAIYDLVQQMNNSKVLPK